MMLLHLLLVPAFFILVAYVLVRCVDITIGAIMARDYLRVVCYGLLALFALLYLLFSH